jgi:hypothetical protein
VGNFHRHRGKSLGYARDKYLCRCPVTKCLVGTLGVVEMEIVTDPDPGISSITMADSET